MLVDKVTCLVLLVAVTASISVFAEESLPTARVAVENQEISESLEVARGFRVSLIKSFLNTEIRSRTGQVEETEQEFGIGVGFADIQIQELGFSARVLYTSFQSTASIDDITSLRLEGNGTYGIYEGANVFAGVHVQAFATSELKDRNPALGFQVGGGYQFTEKLGADLAYVLFNQQFSKETVDYDLSMEGIEISVHATF